MFFSEYTTAVERARGTVDAALLIARHRDDAEAFFGDAAIGNGNVEASIAVGDKIYELTIDLSRIPSEHDGIYLMEMDFDEETREMGSGSAYYLPSTAVPLTWPGLVATLCEEFKLDPDAVWSTGIDVQAHWHDQDEGEYLKVPREADRAKYSIAVLHKSAH